MKNNHQIQEAATGLNPLVENYYSPCPNCGTPTL